MTTSEITLVPLPESRRDTFIRELHTSFAVAVVEEYGPQEGEIIPRSDIEQSLDQPGAEALQILLDGAAVGGAVVSGAQTGRRSLDLLYLRQNCHSRGIGLAAWQAIEARYPDTRYGKPLHRILKSKTFTSMLINAASKSWNFSIPTTGTPGSRTTAS